MNVRSEIELLRRELVNELQVGRGLNGVKFVAEGDLFITIYIWNFKTFD
jgi:hypothetical protein